MPPPKSLHIIINPASGQEHPILAPINKALAEHKLHWDVTLLQPNGEESAVARALEHDPELLVVYGGDGTLARIANVLLKLNTKVPIAPLHGGTANALATHLGAPAELDIAMTMLRDGLYSAFATDVGYVREQAFFLRVSIGFAAELTQHATRGQKESLGVFAYALSTLQALREVEVKEYQLTVDGNTTTHSAIACIVANSGGTGLSSALVSDLDESDARLDAVLIPDMLWAARALANAASGAGLMDGAPRRSGRSISVACEQQVPVHADGEYVGATPVEISLRHHALRLVRFENSQAQPT
jgi:diacylglycerol kinase family enzyme